jgi:bifunctional non-homologous end joining protein LigD
MYANGHEGIVAKRLSAPYRPGRRSADWRKIKCRKVAKFAVIGWTPDLERRQVKSLALGTRERGILAFCGSVGSGLSLQLRRDLFVPLQTARSNRGSGAKSRSTIRWVATPIMATVEYLELSRRGTIREPVVLDISGMM